jgi:pimeloyl-ACP methyl ester carboxylesterase
MWLGETMSWATTISRDSRKRLLMATDRAEFQLPDGRRLAWAEYGSGDGKPVLFFHGGNDSRLAGGLIADAARQVDVRLVCPDRPGYGASTFQPRRQLLDWPADVSRLMDHLGIGLFAVLGHSGGGPHALACAQAMSSRISAVGAVSSPAPPLASNRGMHPMFRVMNVLMRWPTLYRPMARNQLRQMTNSEDRWLSVWSKMQPADGALFDRRPDVAAAIVAEMSEGARQGIDGIVHEAGLYHKDWGFDLSAITNPAVIWHGRRDRQAAPAWAEYLSSVIPGATLTFAEDSGHFSTLIDHGHTILKTLVEAMPSPSDTRM